MTNEEINVLIAERIFGQVACDQWKYTGAPFYGVMKQDCGHPNCYSTSLLVDYAENPAASKQLREKLAERWTWALHRREARFIPGQPIPTKEFYRFEMTMIDANGNHIEEQRADTEEMAVCLCALASVGVDAKLAIDIMPPLDAK